MPTERDQLLAELAAARATVARLEAALDKVNLDRDNSRSSNVANEERHAPRPRKAAARDWPLDLREYMRYGRQMMLPQIGLDGEFSRGDSAPKGPDARACLQDSSNSSMHTSSLSERADSAAPSSSTSPQPESVRLADSSEELS